MPTASAAAPTLIDYAMRPIPAHDIRPAGHSGVINYLSTSRPGSSFGAKPITLPYAQSLTGAGLVIVSNHQYGKPGGTAPSDFTRGFAGGVADARTAWSLHTAAGGGGSAPIFFSVARALSDREIAEQLVLSSHTVHRHVANIGRKLGRTSRTAAVAEAARFGLLWGNRNGPSAKDGRSERCAHDAAARTFAA